MERRPIPEQRPGLHRHARGHIGQLQRHRRQAGRALNVTWSGDAASQAHLYCNHGGIVEDTTLPIIQPFQSTQPTTFTFPGAGGTQQVSASYQTGQYRTDVHTGTITVTGKSPCSSKASQITDVSTPNDEPTSLSGLKGTNVSPGQVIVTGAEQVELTMGDGSVIRLDSNSKVQITDCNEPGGPEPPRSFNVELGLVLGSMWAHVTKAVGSGQAYQVKKERVVAGNRGTIFWITDTRTATTLHVDKDSMDPGPAARARLRQEVDGQGRPDRDVEAGRRQAGHPPRRRLLPAGVQDVLDQVARALLRLRGPQPRVRLATVTVLLALLGALFIGVSDFLGGLASGRSSALTVSVVVQGVGLLTLAPIAAIIGASALTSEGPRPRRRQRARDERRVHRFLHRDGPRAHRAGASGVRRRGCAPAGNRGGRCRKSSSLTLALAGVVLRARGHPARCLRGRGG